MQSKTVAISSVTEVPELLQENMKYAFLFEIVILAIWYLEMSLSITGKLSFLVSREEKYRNNNDKDFSNAHCMRGRNNQCSSCIKTFAITSGYCL